ncbi:hypothetical protein K2173_010335 [Erythroxylum novogranatense]|uniref:Uncharacterized protein n=1 Tax=Erythroxylum novogranatense TaxID=1862640 RepID=A0AAV8TF58_9ROSI|nr:hypothetical protein K2173_010335 [Erythroxylum novogranatense]
MVILIWSRGIAITYIFPCHSIEKLTLCSFCDAVPVFLRFGVRIGYRYWWLNHLFPMPPLDSGGHPAKKGRTRKRNDESPPPITSYSNVVWPEDHPIEIEEAADASPSTTSGARATEQGEPLEPAVESRTDGTSNGCGPWTNVQRRRPRPSVKGRPQTGASASRGASVKEGSRFAALTTVDEGLEPGR